MALRRRMRERLGVSRCADRCTAATDAKLSGRAAHRDALTTKRAAAACAGAEAGAQAGGRKQAGTLWHLDVRPGVREGRHVVLRLGGLALLHAESAQEVSQARSHAGEARTRARRSAAPQMPSAAQPLLIAQSLAGPWGSGSAKEIRTR